MKKVLTLAFLLKRECMCLAMKKRGFGAGYWNGFGGKVEDGETIVEAAIREICEESCVHVEESNMHKVAINDFFFTDGKHLEVHVFFVRVWEGEPTETDEMKPSWFPIAEIPYDRMWADDPYWLPRVLRGEKLRGSVWFKEDGVHIDRMEWNPLLPTLE